MAVSSVSSPEGHPHRIGQLPILVLMPHSRCNCRCLMCDIWKGNHHSTSLDAELLHKLHADLRALGVREVALSGGEPLIHSNLWSLCAGLKALPARITLLSTGLLLERHAEAVVQWCDEVIVSLDGPPQTHDRIRGIAGAYGKLKKAVAALKRQRRDFPVSGRCVLQKQNFRALADIVHCAHEIGLDRISFLAADLTSTAFNRPDGWDESHTGQIRLDEEEGREFAALVETLIAERPEDFAAGFIAEPPERLRRLPRYYMAVNDLGPFPEIRCAAPWISTVIEADGTVKPCFFHAPLGNAHDTPLSEILNSNHAVAFRANLDVSRNPVCRRCVCTLNP